MRTFRTSRLPLQLIADEVATKGLERGHAAAASSARRTSAETSSS
jgi:hypothetical protein